MMNDKKPPKQYDFRKFKHPNLVNEQKEKPIYEQIEDAVFFKYKKVPQAVALKNPGKSSSQYPKSSCTYKIVFVPSEEGKFVYPIHFNEIGKYKQGSKNTNRKDVIAARNFVTKDKDLLGKYPNLFLSYDELDTVAQKYSELLKGSKLFSWSRSDSPLRPEASPLLGKLTCINNVTEELHFAYIVQDSAEPSNVGKTLPMIVKKSIIAGINKLNEKRIEDQLGFDENGTSILGTLQEELETATASRRSEIRDIINNASFDVYDVKKPMVVTFKYNYGAGVPGLEAYTVVSVDEFTPDEGFKDALNNPVSYAVPTQRLKDMLYKAKEYVKKDNPKFDTLTYASQVGLLLDSNFRFMMNTFVEGDLTFANDIINTYKKLCLKVHRSEIEDEFVRVAGMVVPLVSFDTKVEVVKASRPVEQQVVVEEDEEEVPSYNAPSLQEDLDDEVPF